MPHITKLSLVISLTGLELVNIAIILLILIMYIHTLIQSIHLMVQLLMERHGNGHMIMVTMSHFIITFLKPLET